MKELIDSRNENLWNSINEKFNVTFEDSINGEYACYSQNNDIIFYINQSNLSKDSFTHEMLHVYMRMNDCYIGAGLENTIKGSRILSSILSANLIEHMGNCLDHIKMLPIYIELGFEKEKFIMDYFEYKCTQEEIQMFKKFYQTNKKINLNAVDPYIGRLISILADPNDKFDYKNDLSELKKIDTLLFQIIENFINHWKLIKIENRKPFEDDYHSVLFKFYENIKIWISKNKIRN